MARNALHILIAVVGIHIAICNPDEPLNISGGLFAEAVGEQNKATDDGWATQLQSMQVLDEEARIFMIPNFLSNAECDHLISKAEPLLQRSGVVQTQKDGSGAAITHNIRTSSGAFLNRGGDDVISSIEARIARWTLLPVGNGEDVQVLHYEPDEKYDAHWDYFFDNSSTVNGGNRYATVLVYLSDAQEGGETIFPLIPAAGGANADASECARESLAVKPVKGTALLFHSMTPAGALEPKSLHASCPVISGAKWVMTKWIHTGHFQTNDELKELIKARVQAHMEAQAKKVQSLQSQLALTLGVLGVSAQK